MILDPPPAWSCGGLILTGPRAAGKTTIARALTTAVGSTFAQPVGTTTRRWRPGDSGEYEYVTSEQFAQDIRTGQMFVSSEYAGASYGVRYAAFDELRRRGLVPVLTLTPDAAVSTAAHRGWHLLVLDASDEVLDERLVQRSGGVRPADRDQRTADRLRTAGLLRIDTSGPVEQTIARCAAELAVEPSAGRSSVAHGAERV